MAVRSDDRAAAHGAGRLDRVLAASRLIVPDVLARTVRIAEVAAPTDDEGARSSFVRDLMMSLPVTSVGADAMGNVLATIKGRRSGPPLLIAAHLDTVFPQSTPLRFEVGPDRIAGPGVGDNCLGIACTLAIADVLHGLGIQPAVDILLTGNVGEEGLGNLRGIRRVMDDHPEIGAVVAVEGHNLGRVTHVAVGSRRLRVRVLGPGGHSWGDHGNANAIQGAAEIIHELSRISLPSSPKTTINVGTIRGGISVNTIPPDATFDVDLRSVEEFALKRLADRTERIIRTPRTGLRVELEVIGDRPAGYVAPDSFIVRAAVQVLDALGVSPAGDASSTDANIPIARHVPAVCIGLTTGGFVHREDEYIDTAPVAVGLTQLIELSLTLADALADGTLTC
ncbi:MAG: M20/M25/M40 family metallo-hydrolase [Thermomicrobiales bacterium]